MTLPSLQRIYDVIDGTWPPAVKQAVGPWIIRLDNSNSSRVSAAMAAALIGADDIEPAEQAMRNAAQTPLFMIRAGDSELDRLLQARGYHIKDPVNIYAASLTNMTLDMPPVEQCRAVWPPLPAQVDIWRRGGIGPGRLAIMDRALAPKTTVIGQLDDRPAGTVFISMAADCAMIHALEVDAPYRNRHLGRHLTCAAGMWAQSQGAPYLTLITTQANVVANRLYASLGMTVVGHYHYRILPEPPK